MAEDPRPLLSVTQSLLVTAAVAAGMVHVTWADVPVEGDRELLTQLIAAQEANQAALRRGRMRLKAAETHYSSPDEKRMWFGGEAILLWDSDRERWEYSGNYESYDPELRQPGSITDNIFIRTSQEIITYNPGPEPGKGLLRVMPFRRMGTTPTFARTHPQKWFVLEGWDRWKWKEFFDPSNERGTITGIHVWRDGDRIIVHRSYLNDLSLRIEASLAHGGNVVRYESHNRLRTAEGEVERIESGSYEWASDANDVWYVNKCHFQHVPNDAPDKLTWEFSLKMLEFTSTPEVSDFDFSVASIEAAQGDRIDIRSK